MPVDYSIDRSLRIVFSRGWGVVTAADLFAHQDRLREDAAFDPSFDQIYDLLELVKSEVDEAELKRLAERNPFLTSVRRAFVVSSENGGQPARRFVALARLGPSESQVFSSIEEAREWLFLD